jgi:hypothetical protein
MLLNLEVYKFLIMAMPKGYRTNIDIVNHKIGPERRQEILDDIADNGTFLPRGVLEEDMDQSFIDFVGSKDGFLLTIDGEKVPVIFLTIQRWTEFTKTWQFSDKYKNITLPFITVVRKPDIQQGQNQAGLWNIPGNRTYTYMKVPTFDGVRRGVDLYKVPQPTSVDLMYEVRLFTNKMKDLNKFNRIIQRAFQSRQCYLNVNGHPMPLHLETIGDESNVEDFENRRFYVQLFEMKLLGYLLDEEDYEIVPTINRSVISTEIDERKLYTDVIFDPIIRGAVVTYSFVFKPRAEASFTYTAQYDANFTQLVDVENRIVISINGVVVFDGLILTSPIMIYANDIINIRVYKSFYTEGAFKLIGSTTS